MEVQPKLSMKLNNSQAVALADLVASYQGLVDEYNRHVSILDNGAPVKDIRLYVHELRSGSIISEFIAAAAPAIIPFVENANTIIDFAQHLGVNIEFLLGRSPNQNGDRRTYENIIKLVEPVAKDGGAQFNVSTMIEAETVNIFNITSVEANAIQNAARREIASIQEPVTGIHEKVLLYLHQAKNDPQSRSGDRGVIETLYPGPVKVIFATDQLKLEMLRSTENPFTCGFIVDVEAGTVQGKPVTYKVLRLYERLDLNDAA